MASAYPLSTRYRRSYSVSGCDLVADRPRGFVADDVAQPGAWQEHAFDCELSTAGREGHRASPRLSGLVATADRRLETQVLRIGANRIRTRIRTHTEDEKRFGAYRPHHNARRCD